jgi:hypothetical protein
MTNPRLVPDDDTRDRLDRTGRDDLAPLPAAVAAALGKAVARRADKLGHAVGSFLADIEAAGYTVTAIPPPPPAAAVATPFATAPDGGPGYVTIT